MSSGIKYHMTNTFPLRKNSCCLCYKHKCEEDYNVFPNLPPGLHSSNFLGFWEVDIYFTCLLSCRNEISFPSFSHLAEVFFPTHRNNYSISRPPLCLLFHPALEKQRPSWWKGSKEETRVQGSVRLSFIFPSLLAMLISATADTVKFYARHELAQILYLKKIPSNMGWIFDYLPQDPAGCLRKSKTGQI